MRRRARCGPPTRTPRRCKTTLRPWATKRSPLSHSRSSSAVSHHPHAAHRLGERGARFPGPSTYDAPSHQRSPPLRARPYRRRIIIIFTTRLGVQTRLFVSFCLFWSKKFGVLGSGEMGTNGVTRARPSSRTFFWRSGGLSHSLSVFFYDASRDDTAKTPVCCFVCGLSFLFFFSRRSYLHPLCVLYIQVRQFTRRAFASSPVRADFEEHEISLIVVVISFDVSRVPHLSDQQAHPGIQQHPAMKLISPLSPL